MNKTPEVSLIVPVFNSSSFIIRTLNNLHKQDFVNVEFLIIDDGSSDDSFTKIENYVKNTKDSRFSIFHKINGGVSSARNYGLNHAKGTYIMFMDSDDECKSDYVSGYYNRIIQNKSDIEGFQAEELENGALKFNKIEMPALNDYSNQKITAAEFILLYAQQKIFGYPWLFISKRSLWQNVRFNESITYQEDNLALIELIVRNPEVTIHLSDKAYYFYTLNSSSVSCNLTVKLYWQTTTVNNILVSELEDTKFNNLCSAMRARNLTNLSSLIGLSLIRNDKDSYNKARKLFLNIFLEERKNIYKPLKWKRNIEYILLLFNFKSLLKRAYVKVLS